ncbi:lysozyme [Paracoccus sp. SY]|uniref:lysozyme n=1 Tax=Paracoccus sp. SY TaxID=1330255 RepID=UPI000CD09927|nr:lysozyme [Paracoccus sp. SY]
MQTSEKGIALIKAHEGLRLEAYPDPAHGWAVPTIGYGHTSAAGSPPVTKGMRITEAGATEILRNDLRKFERYVLDAVTVPLNQNQFDALVSFTFNLGPGNLRKSTLLRKLNARDYAGAADQFLVWNMAGGKVLNGLTKRRTAERALFLTPAQESPRPAPKPTPAPARAAPAGGGVIAVVVAAIAAVAAFIGLR